METLELKQGDKVKYEEDNYIIVHVWNHGGGNVWYDLEAESELLGLGFKRVQLSVHYTELTIP